MSSVFLGTRFTDRDLITSILASFYIVDYGFISAVNVDKTVNVTHAKRMKTQDGDTMKPTVTNNVEMLTLSGQGFSLSLDYKKGDKVVLLGLKDYVPDVDDVKSATETKVYLHYSRETIKALPLCVFNADAKVTVEIKDGTMDLSCTKFKVTNSSGVAALEVSP